MHIKRWAIGALIVALVATMAVVAVASAHNNSQSQAGEQSGIPRYQHVFVVMMENHSFAETFNNPATPFINSLANTYGLATDYFGVTHPSEPNYVASIVGSFFGIQDDAPYTTHTITSPSVAGQLEAAGLSWKTYQQALPYAGFTASPSPAPALPSTPPSTTRS